MTTVQKLRAPLSKNTATKTRYTQEVKNLLTNTFSKYISRIEEAPSLDDIQKLIMKYPNLLGDRTAAAIKTWLHGQRI